jgi:hypothetical protein
MCHQVRSVPSRSMEEFDVTDFDPTRRVEIQGAIGPFQARISYALEAMGDEMKLANAVELTPSSIAWTLLGPLGSWAGEGGRCLEPGSAQASP